MNKFLEKHLINKINDSIYYIPAEESPVLSAECFFICENDMLWIYDVGASEKSLKIIETALESEEYKNRCNIVISHFHEDHASNLNLIKGNYNLYTSKYTLERYQRNLNSNCLTVNIIDKIFNFNYITLFPIPAIHAKGCLGLQYNNYALIGDSFYCKYINGHVTYNQQLLRDQKKLFENLCADNFICSHEAPQIKTKTDISNKINKLLSFAVKDSPYISF